MGPKTGSEAGVEWMKAFDVGGLMDMQRKAFEAMLEGWGKAASGYQKLAARQMEMMRETMDEVNAALTDLGSKGGKPGEAQLDLARRALERASGNMKELMSLAASANTEAMQSMQAQVAALFAPKSGTKRG